MVAENLANDSKSNSSIDRGTVPASPIIRLRDIQKTFRRVGGEEVKAVDGVHLDVAQGEMLVLLGPSGCGKTTLLRCVAGLEPPDGGSVELAGRVVSGADLRIIPPEAREIGMMFQTYALWPHMSVFQNIAYPLESRKIQKDTIADRVKNVLRLVGIESLIDQHPGSLSGGQQQRVALARSLVAEPRVMLFDEPLSNVDAQVRSQLRHEISQMQRRLGFAGIYVTHDQEEAMELAHRLAVMRVGQVAQVGTPREIYSHPNSRYVAEFVGDANIWEVTTKGPIDSHECTFRAEGIGQVVARRNEVERVNGLPGGARWAMSRPESLHLLPAGDAEPDRPNIWYGVIRWEVFGGAHTQYTVRLESGAEVVAKSPRALDVLPSEGSVVAVYLDPADVRLLPPDGDDSSHEDRDLSEGASKPGHDFAPALPTDT